MKVSEVLEDYRGRYASYEIYYRPSRRAYPFEWKLLSHDGDNRISDKIPIEDWLVHDYELLYEDDYFHIHGDFPYSFKDLYGSPDAQVLVIYISHLTYRILSDKNAKTVRDLRTEYIGQFHEYLVCKYRSHGGLYDDDDDSDYGNGYGYCDDYGYESPQRDYYCDGMKYFFFDELKAVDAPQELLDKMWAEECFIVENSDAEDLFINVKGYGWWDEESFEEHFADPDRVAILVIILF